MQTKYIRNQHRFIVFHPSCQHRDMAVQALGHDKLIHGAGFMRLNFDGERITAQCYGVSESLRKGPRPDDHTAILKSIGVENQDDELVTHAKYVIRRGKAVVFYNEIEHAQVAKAAYMGSMDCDSAGFVKFLAHPSGKIKVQCYGESMSLGVSSKPDDYKIIAELMEIPADWIFAPQNKLGI